MKKNNLLNFFTISFLLVLPIKSNAEIIILSSCDSKKDGFLKNEYILDLDQSLMVRNYVFNEKRQARKNTEFHSQTGIQKRPIII